MTDETSVQNGAVLGGHMRNVPRILVVDDDEPIRKLFGLILSSAIPDGEIDIVVNGAEAVETFEKKQHSVVLMDLHMPVMDGRAAFFEIEKKCREADREMPAVVFCTGFAPPESVTKAVENSPKHCLLSKPVDSQTLVETVKARLG